MVEDTVEGAEREVQSKRDDIYLANALGKWMKVWNRDKKIWNRNILELAMNNESGLIIRESESNEIRITAPF